MRADERIGCFNSYARAYWQSTCPNTQPGCPNCDPYQTALACADHTSAYITYKDVYYTGTNCSAICLSHRDIIVNFEALQTHSSTCSNKIGSTQ